MTEALATGRIVWGHPGKAQPKKQQDGPNKGQPVLKQDGTPVLQYSFGLAIPKYATLVAQGATPEMLQTAFDVAVWPAMDAEIKTGYPNGVPPRFAYKYQDGDGIDSKGQPFNQREGYAGCYVLAITTEIAPPLYQWDAASGKYLQIEAERIKCGDYVRVGLNLKVNVATGTNTPSIYVNPTAVQFVGYGSEIRNGPDAVAIFGQQGQVALPPGASAVPMAGGGNVGMPGMPGAGAPAGYPAPQGQPMAPAGYPAPAHDFVQNAGMQPQPQMQQPQGQPMAPQGYPQQPGYAPAPQGYAPGPQPGMMPPR